MHKRLGVWLSNGSMRIIYNLEEYRPVKPTVVTTGTFDGVHLGHRRIIERLLRLSAERQLESVVITFWPHPRLVLGQSLELLHTIEERAACIGRMGIDTLLILPFTEAFAQLSPEAYVEKIYVSGLHARYLVIGYDHHFGYQRQGNLAFLQQISSKYGFEVEEIPKQDIDDIAISSTRIRKALKEGDVELATQLLGYPYALSGRVVDGQKLGRVLGFPTANLMPLATYKLVPGPGIYAAYASYGQVENHPALVYIGKRPTLGAQLQSSIEVFLFDFSASLYNEIIQVRFLKKLRDDQQFNTLADLQQQMQRDYQHARNFFAQQQ